MLRDHLRLISILSLFVLIQIYQLYQTFFNNLTLIFIYEMSLIYVIIIIAIKIFSLNTLRGIIAYLKVPFLLLLIANIIVFSFYLPNIYFNPEVNWALKNNGKEADPMILLIIFPIINFITSFLLIFLIVCVKLLLNKFYGIKKENE